MRTWSPGFDPCPPGWSPILLLGRDPELLVQPYPLWFLAGFLSLGRSSIGFTWGEMALPFLTLLAQILVYLTLSLVLSLVCLPAAWLP
jgi:hypothetical protein